jgi:hypothetical protein
MRLLQTSSLESLQECNMQTRIVEKILAFLSAVLLSLTFVVVVQAEQITDPDRALQPGENLQTAKVVGVQAHPEGRPFDYVNDSSSLAQIYDDYPYYDITLQVGGKKFVVRYDNMGGYFPSAWKPGNEVKVREDAGRLYILRYDGVLVSTGIL